MLNTMRGFHLCAEQEKDKQSCVDKLRTPQRSQRWFDREMTHVWNSVQKKEFFEEKWAREQNPREGWSAPTLFFYCAMHRLRAMKYIDGIVCSQIDSVIAQSGFCCADDKLFLSIDENFLLLRKKWAPVDLTQRRDGGQCTVGVGLRRRVRRVGWVRSMCGCVGMRGGDCSGNC